MPQTKYMIYKVMTERKKLKIVNIKMKSSTKCVNMNDTVNYIKVKLLFPYLTWIKTYKYQYLLQKTQIVWVNPKIFYQDMT